MKLNLMLAYALLATPAFAAGNDQSVPINSIYRSNQPVADKALNQATATSDCCLEGKRRRTNHSLNGAKAKWLAQRQQLTYAGLPSLRSVTPNQDVAPGDTITLEGESFLNDPMQDVVTIGSKSARVSRASDRTLQVIVPEGLDGGTAKVYLTVAGRNAGYVEITIVAVPEVSAVSLQSGPPGQHVTISGKNFAKKPSDNVVTFGGAQATVVGGNTSSLDVIIPEMANPVYNVPVSVRVGKLKSKNHLTINVQQRVY